MGDLERVMYHPLLEDDSSNNEGWNKETIQYVLKNETKIRKKIRQTALGFYKKHIQKCDVDDIMGNIYLYLYKADDYDINKAIERSSTGTIVALDGYINQCIRFCIMRYFTENKKKESNEISEHIPSDSPDKELSLFDTIQDNNAEIDLDDLSYTLDELCKSCEPARYKYGEDLFLVMYLNVLTHKYGVQDKYKEIMDILGIDNKSMEIYDRSSDDSIMLTLAKMITRNSEDYVISVLRNYVHASNLIHRAVMSFC